MIMIFYGKKKVVTVTMLSLLEVDIVLMKITMKPAAMTVVTAVTLMQTQTIVHYVSVIQHTALQLAQLLQLPQLLQLQVIFRKKQPIVVCAQG